MHLRNRGSPMRSRPALGAAVKGGSRCQVATHRDRRVIAKHKPGARPASAESGSVAGGALAARTGPQRCRRSNPAARQYKDSRARGSRCPELVERRRSHVWRIGAFATAPPCPKRPAILRVRVYGGGVEGPRARIRYVKRGRRRRAVTGDRTMHGIRANRPGPWLWRRRAWSAASLSGGRAGAGLRPRRHATR